MADPFGVDLPTLIVQADSFAAQIRATPALAAAARPADPEAVRLALLAAARQADDALTARSLAQGDLDRANRRARAMVAEVSTWRAALLRDAQVLVDRGAVWAVDVGAIRSALDFRRVRFAGTWSGLEAALPMLHTRAVAIAAVRPTIPEAEVVTAGLQEAPALVERMKAAGHEVDRMVEARRVAVLVLQAAREALLVELRRVEHLWAAARGRSSGQGLPALDMTWVRAARGRRAKEGDGPPEEGG